MSKNKKKFVVVVDRIVERTYIVSASSALDARKNYKDGKPVTEKKVSERITWVEELEES